MAESTAGGFVRDGGRNRSWRAETATFRRHPGHGRRLRQSRPRRQEDDAHRHQVRRVIAGDGGAADGGGGARQVAGGAGAAADYGLLGDGQDHQQFAERRPVCTLRRQGVHRRDPDAAPEHMRGTGLRPARPRGHRVASEGPRRALDGRQLPPGAHPAVSFFLIFRQFRRLILFGGILVSAFLVENRSTMFHCSDVSVSAWNQLLLAHAAPHRGCFGFSGLFLTLPLFAAACLPLFSKYAVGVGEKSFCEHPCYHPLPPPSRLLPHRCLRFSSPSPGGINRTLDHLVSFGERMSVRMMAAALNKAGVPAQHFDAWTIGIRTTSEFGNADVLPESLGLIAETMKRIDDNMVAVVTGFIGHSEDGKITTLGRGGSDLTATVIGAAVKADEIQVWKDVDGMMTADPRAVPAAVPVPCVSYEEAAELAYFGAKILHPVSMRPAMKAGIPVRIKNSYNPDHPGTVIVSQRDRATRGATQLVTAITFKSGVELIDIVSTRMLGQYGFLSRVFSVFAECRVSVDMVATSEVSVSLTLDPSQSKEAQLAEAVRQLRTVADVTESEGKGIISLIANVGRSSEVMAEVFQVMSTAGIQVLMLSQGASKVNVGLVVDDTDCDRAVRALHAHFFEGKPAGTAEASSAEAAAGSAAAPERPIAGAVTTAAAVAGVHSSHGTAR
ncbi:unnamed protein product [Phaeothamnion confervicola]